ncbi:MAG TPA: hypothetical protein VFM48_06620, partial [Aquabacterium sp.]|nr:hypothetical protein [Aquabacterium sp.]
MNANKQIAWECFSDPSYFDMWAVKQINKTGFDDAFHVTSEVEARRLCALLNTPPAAAPAPAVPQGWKVERKSDLRIRVESPSGDAWSFENVDDRGSSNLFVYQMLDAMLTAPSQEPAVPQGEPFGYFRAEPFGWTDCAETDEGAIALYERPAAPAVPQGAEMPLSMNQFGRLVELTREH